ncbi:hypothetical protein DSM3645_03073 [Blastopirellula marina DSM 3645]|uniref:Uncharacterized protein n=1 Tax=Blastopirellula marina DSM 3645 TaxID=314230 RepID=A3ZVS8_9BACT|nr:hypothetical protein DSM3645_03073 [Blastopirellula marina DSM 3645]
MGFILLSLPQPFTLLIMAQGRSRYWQRIRNY